MIDRNYFQMILLSCVFLGCDLNPSKTANPPSPQADLLNPGEENSIVDVKTSEEEQYAGFDSLIDKYYELRLQLRENFSERLRESDQINYRKSFLRRPAHVGCLAELPLDDLTIQFEGEKLLPRDVITTTGGIKVETPSESGETVTEITESIPFKVFFDESETIQTSWNEIDRSYIASASEKGIDGAEGKKVLDLDRIRIQMEHWNYFYQKFTQNKANIFKHIFGSSNEVHVDVFSEDSRFLLKRVTVKLRGQVIYDRSGLAHRFESEQGLVPPGFTQGLVWEDLNIRSNPAWVSAQRLTQCPD